MFAKTNIKSGSYPDCPFGAWIWTHGTKNTFRGQYPLTRMGIIEKFDVHRTFLFTNSTVNAFLPVNTDFKQRKASEYLLKCRYRTKIFTESTIILGGISKQNPADIIQGIAYCHPEYDFEWCILREIVQTEWKKKNQSKGKTKVDIADYSRTFDSAVLRDFPWKEI